MCTTVAAALKRLTVYLLTDKRVFKIAGGIVLGIIVIIVMPIVVLLGIFGGGVEIDTDRLHGMIAEQQSASTDRWAEAESAMADAGVQRSSDSGGEGSLYLRPVCIRLRV